ncbi:PTS sugar transporter subunit IIA [Methylocapsa palsarum]|uniref:PTS system, nitrogen regulatory IIA component n=1 Tax=Methylocapsa palsarum TaxID=1612308 RepID=A0A1I4CZ10_9HYPH|nr:PTS sugar transporter subunit IIA [Methylocapsa palsarum]SFK86568.1 PTS system, nitrogen regulatory IIA component [Methylocapsa palsarum]
MDFLDLIDPSRVVFSARFPNKEQLLRNLASRAANCLDIDKSAILNALQTREELGSTGLGGGFALPHARVEGLDKPFCLFMSLQRPIDYGSIDDNPVDLIFLLLSPTNIGSEHLGALAAISRRLRDQEFAQGLRNATSAAALCSVLRGRKN